MSFFKPLALLALGMTVGSTVGHTIEAAKEKANKFVQGELIVKLRPGVKKSLFQKSLGLKGLTLEREIKLSYGTLYVVKVAEELELKAAEKSLESLNEVEYAEPNFIWSINNSYEADESFVPNDPSFSMLWGLKNTGNNTPAKDKGFKGVAGADIDALRAWEITKGDSRIKIAVIDTGIDYNHPDLKDNMWVNEAEEKGRAGVDDDGNGYIDDIRGYDFANNDGDAMDDHSHGTHCAGTIGAIHDNGLGVAGVMSEVTLVPVKFLSSTGSGTTEAAIRSIDYATKLNVDIMSNSWGGGGFSQALEDAIRNAAAKGIVFTAAAGNSSADNDVRPNYPSNYNLPNVVAVAAHTSDDTLATFSSYGKRTVHVAAPGHKVLSTVKGGTYAVYSGTSMATPHVSGMIGLLLAKEGRVPFADLRDRLINTSVPVNAHRRKNASGGRMNAYNLLTNTRPERNEPNPDAWQRFPLNERFESVHPYPHNAAESRTYTVPGAKYVRVKVERFDLESGYDILKISNKSRAIVENVSGVGENYATEYVEGDTVSIDFVSDSSVNRWGFLITEIEYIP